MDMTLALTMMICTLALKPLNAISNTEISCNSFKVFIDFNQVPTQNERLM